MRTKNVNILKKGSELNCGTRFGNVAVDRMEVEGEKNLTFSSPPAYRMPPQPLYGESANIPGSIAQIHTHSNKFPIEREVILSNGDKSSKIPILNEYHKKHTKSAVVCPDVPNVQVAWPEDRMYGEMRNTPMQENLPVGAHRTYKAQPFSILETTNGTEPSPIANPEDSNGFSPSTAKSNGRSHSTPEENGKAFPSRTYHTIKDMISSKFGGKSKMDQTGLNNCDLESGKPDESLSPNSQLVQHGVYLANSQHQQQHQQQLQQLSRSPRIYPKPSPADAMKRNQEIRDQLYRERAVDINQTVALQQASQPVQYHQQQSQVYSQPLYMQGRPLQQPQGQIHPSHLHPHHHQQGNPHLMQQQKPHIPHHVYAGPSNSSEGIYQKTPTTTRSQVRNIQRLDELTAPKPFLGRNEGRVGRANSDDRLLDLAALSKNVEEMKLRSKSVDNVAIREEEMVGNEEECGPSSDCEKHARNGQHSDSGRGSTVYSSGQLKHPDTSPDSEKIPAGVKPVKEPQWVDVVESELKHILDPKVANSTISDSSESPPLPIASNGSSDERNVPYKSKNSLHVAKCESTHRPSLAAPSAASGMASSHKVMWTGRSAATATATTTAKDKSCHQLQRLVVSKRTDNQTIASSLDLDSMLDENNTSDDDLSLTDARTIRKQLEGLENMYSEVLKLLGVRKSTPGSGRYQPSDPRIHRRRLYGSVSSLPSSVSSRPIRDRHRRTDDRKKVVRDLKGINKRFLRLESHVVTLARSVAHLSSEMRTQHLMIQEMELIRNELSSLRAQTQMLSSRSHSLPRYQQVQNAEQANSSPDKVKKLTRFFGDEPPLLRLFLKKLGYEKYASVFEKERIGLVELPYMSEEKFQKLGVPMGPRLRIMQEAQLGFPGAHENTLCIV